MELLGSGDMPFANSSVEAVASAKSLDDPASGTLASGRLLSGAAGSMGNSDEFTEPQNLLRIVDCN